MASNSKKRRRVLGASCILAALIIASSSFAWFTSKDEVTNRLSASANYGVTIAENFTPPENWVPGQEIDKDVAVVNTGNVDAFVRTWLEGEMDLLAQTRDKAKWNSSTTVADKKFVDGANAPLNDSLTYDSSSTTATITGLTDTSDENLKALGMTYSYGTGANKVYLKELDTTIYENPNSPTTAKDNPAYFNDVMTVQAGGVLAYLETGAAAGETVFLYRPNQGMTIKTDDSTAAGESGTTYALSGDTQYTVKIDPTTTKFTAGSAIENDTIMVDGTTIYVKSEAAIIKYLGNYIDSDNFYPTATGLYIFRRNADKVDNSNDPTRSDYEFSGYYYVKTKDGVEIGKPNPSGTDPEKTAKESFEKQGKYFALQYVKGEDDGNRSDYVLEKDTYTVARTTAGDVTFYPTRTKTGTYNSGANTAYSPDGTNWYDSDTGYSVAAAEVTADTTPAKSVTLFTAQQSVIDYAHLNWNYVAANTKYLTYTNTDSSLTKYVVGDDVYDKLSDIKIGKKSATAKTALTTGAGYTIPDDSTATSLGSDAMLYAFKDNVIIDIKLANVVSDDTNDRWKILSDTTSGSPTNKYTFYYTNDVEEGCTTEKLVDSVTLDQSVTQDDYIAFDFDLNVKMDSVQVTLDNAGNETTTAAASEFATGDAPVKITGVTDGDTSSEAGSLTWTNA